MPIEDISSCPIDHLRAAVELLSVELRSVCSELTDLGVSGGSSTSPMAVAAISLQLYRWR